MIYKVSGGQEKTLTLVPSTDNRKNSVDWLKALKKVVQYRAGKSLVEGGKRDFWLRGCHASFLYSGGLEGGGGRAFPHPDNYNSGLHITISPPPYTAL